jgi:hypothetical protein
MERFPIKSVAKDTRQLFLRPQVGAPVPRKETCDGDANIVPIRRKGLEQGLGTGLLLRCSPTSPS